MSAPLDPLVGPPPADPAVAPPSPVSPALATRMLPLVARIAADLQDGWQAWREAVEHYEATALAEGTDTQVARDALAHVERRAAAVEALRRELVPLAASCPSPRTARIEWLTEIAGIAGRLVWYPGDEVVRRWVPVSEAASSLRELPGDS